MTRKAGRERVSEKERERERIIIIWQQQYERFIALIFKMSEIEEFYFLDDNEDDNYPPLVCFLLRNVCSAFVNVKFENGQE